MSLIIVLNSCHKSMKTILMNVRMEQLFISYYNAFNYNLKQYYNIFHIYLRFITLLYKINTIQALSMRKNFRRTNYYIRLLFNIIK
jgi:hypothetical protein